VDHAHSPSCSERPPRQPWGLPPRGTAASPWPARCRAGILIGHVGAYDLHSRFLLGPLFRSIAADVAAVANSSRVLEVGCGPGHLSLRLAREHGLDVTGLDLDPAMIDHARANAERRRRGADRAPAFVVGDAASPPFPDDSFDLVEADKGPGRDRPRAAAGRPSAHLGRAAWPRAVPWARPRSAHAPSRLRAVGRQRDAVALAVEAQPPQTDRGPSWDGAGDG
jgi:SAM-dependent methyltransferase